MTVATVVKLVGASQVYTTLQGWEDGAPANLVTAEKWDAGTFVGTFTQGETVTGTGLTAGKFLDSDQATYVTFGIVTGNSATLVTLTGASSGATCVVSTKTDTGVIWQGQINASSDAFTAAVTIAGSTAGTTTYKELTTKTGASFRDHASVQTNALIYDASKGASCTHSTAYANFMTITEDYGRASNLQITGTGSARTALASSTGWDINNCILDQSGTGVDYQVQISGTGKLRNSLVCRRSAHSGIIARVSNTGGCFNVSFIVKSDVTQATNLLDRVPGNYSNMTFTNCAGFGGTNLSAAVAGGWHSFTTCCADDASPPTGVTTLAYDGTTFVSTTGDWKPLTGSGLLDVGTTDSTNAPTDIVGTSRPQGSAYDVGCWELVVAAGGGGNAGRLLFAEDRNYLMMH